MPRRGRLRPAARSPRRRPARAAAARAARSRRAPPSRGHAPRREGRRLRPPVGARRMPAHRRTVRRATARRRRGTAPADVRRRRRAGSECRSTPGIGHRRPPADNPNAARKAARCRSRHVVEVLAHRPQQLVHRGEWELRFGFDAGSAQNPERLGVLAPRSPTAPTCRYPPHRAAPAPRCGPARARASNSSICAHSR